MGAAVFEAEVEHRAARGDRLAGRQADAGAWNAGRGGEVVASGGLRVRPPTTADFRADSGRYLSMTFRASFTVVTSRTVGPEAMNSTLPSGTSENIKATEGARWA